MPTLISPDISSVTACGDPNRQAAFVVPAGEDVSLLWQVMDASGNPVSVPTSLPGDGPDYSEPPGRMALVTTLFCDRAIPLLATIGVHASGRLVIGLPASVSTSPNLYLVEVRWTDDDGTYSRTTLMSVEVSLANRYGGNLQTGPLPLSQVRTRLRDYPEFNDITGRFEFSAEEILEAIARPVMYWNETAPVVSRHGITTFPFRSQWLDATVSTLYQTSAHWMLRNDVPIQAEGVSASERSATKWQYMLNFSASMWQEYQRFVSRQKGMENVRGGFLIM